MLAVRSRFRPRIGRSRAFRRPWSDSTRLLAYCVVSCSASGRSSVIAPAKARERSVVTSIGLPWAPTAQLKNHLAAFASRFFETKTSMTWPTSSTARYTYLQDPDTLTYVSSTNQRRVTACRQEIAASARIGVNRWTQRNRVTWSTLDATFSQDLLEIPVGQS